MDPSTNLNGLTAHLPKQNRAPPAGMGRSGTPHVRIRLAGPGGVPDPQTVREFGEWFKSKDRLVSERVTLRNA